MSAAAASPPAAAVLALQDGATAFDDRLEFVSVIIEIAVLSFLFYAVLRLLRGTRGLAVLKGALLGAFGLVLALWSLSAFLDLSFPRLQTVGGPVVSALVVVLVVLFQQELRRGLTRLGERGRFIRGADAPIPDITPTIMDLSHRRIGALLVFESRTGLATLEETGVPLDAALCGELIDTIFVPSGPLHDGALLVREGRIVAAGCMLPLSDAPTISRELGTRHRAALGVTEESDAVALVVSEETGRVSVGHRGMLHHVEDLGTLRRVLADCLADTPVVVAEGVR